MAFPDLAANLLYTVLCLVPGFISLQTVRLTTDLEMELSEFEKSTWSLIGSGVSLSVLYFCYVGVMTLGTGRFRLIHSLDLGWVDLLAVYPLLIGVAALVGYVSALVILRSPGRHLSSRSRGPGHDEEVRIDEGPNM